MKVAGATFRAVAEDKAFDAAEDDDCCWRKKHLPARAWHLTPNFIAMNRSECRKATLTILNYGDRQVVSAGTNLKFSAENF